MVFIVYEKVLSLYSNANGHDTEDSGSSYRSWKGVTEYSLSDYLPSSNKKIT